MKKIIVLLVAIISLNTFAQKELKEGVITMKMTMSTENEQAKAALAMMGDIAMTTYFKGEKSRTEQSHQMTGDNISIVDNKSKKVLVLLSNPMLGKKYTQNDIETSQEDLKNVTVTAKGDTKSIVGYTCKGYDVVVKKDGVETKMIMYTTDKILAPTQNTAMLGDKLKGMPLYMIMNVNQGGMDMQITMEVTEVKDEKVADSKFDMTIPEGYSKMEMPKPPTVD